MLHSYPLCKANKSVKWDNTCTCIKQRKQEMNHYHRQKTTCVELSDDCECRLLEDTTEECHVLECELWSQMIDVPTLKVRYGVN